MRARTGARIAGLAVAAALATVAAIACTAERTVEPLAGYLPVIRPVVATDRIWPPGELTAELGPGWNVREPTDARVLRIPERPVEVIFQSTAGGDLTLELEVKPLAAPDEISPVLLVSLNDAPARQFRLARRWRIKEIVFRGDELRIGPNRMTFEMDGVPARLASMRLISAFGRAAWPGRTTRVELSPPGPGEVIPGISAPADSLVEVALDLPPEATLRSRLQASHAPGTRRGSLRASVELVTSPAGRGAAAVELVSVDLDSSRPEAGLDLDLSAHRGQAVVLRLRTGGDANGLIRWGELRLEHSGPAMADPIGEIDGDLAVPSSSGRLGRPDVVLILLDAARADALSAYGSPRPTPALDEIGSAGTLVATASSPAPWTGPAVPSLLTGLLPDAHGVEIWNRRLPESLPTMPELLRDAGYRTFLFTHHLIWAGNPTLRRGFDRRILASHLERDRMPLVEEIFDNERPTFALLHLLLPHAPYDPPPPHRGRYTGESSGSKFDVTARKLGSFRRPRATNRPGDEYALYARARYDETVAWVDAQVAVLLDRLRAAGRYDDALVILTSDHGEAFGEHGSFLHTRLLYEEVLRVPLLWKWPASVAGHAPRLDAPASLVDLLPTLLDGLAIPAPDGSRFHGRSLLPAIFTGKAIERARYATTRVTERAGRAPKPQLAFVEDDLKIILDMPTGRVELYDLAADPAEARDIAARRPVSTRQLLQRMLAQRRRNELFLLGAGPDNGSFELEPETIEQLRALGYVR